jgi:uncharacterized membrane protein YdbT with pleckstrin-like domain
MSYIEEHLMPNERVILTARIHAAIFMAPILFFFLAVVLFLGGWAVNARQAGSGTLFLLLSVFLLISALLMGLKALVLMATTELAVTNQRILAKTGLIRQRTLELLLHKVESVGVSQNLGGRLMNFGTVVITGTGGTREGFRGIAAPLTLRKRITQVIQDQAQVQ